MNAIEIMNEEHRLIERMIKVVRKVCMNVLQGEDINYDDFYIIVDFIKNYADDIHHKKEEDVLFNKMIEHLGESAEIAVKHGMMVEHDLGRLYIRDLVQALENVKSGNGEGKLDIIANAISYTHLLERHIDKEDRVIYKFAQRGLSKEILEEVDKDCIEFENKSKDMKDKYILDLINLENKYI